MNSPRSAAEIAEAWLKLENLPGCNCDDCIMARHILRTRFLIDALERWAEWYGDKMVDIKYIDARKAMCVEPQEHALLYANVRALRSTASAKEGE